MIKVHNPNNLPLIDYRELNPLQGNLKDMHKKDYEKLRQLIAQKGFLFPFFVWFNHEDGKPYLIDGHGRHRVCMTENVQPYELPYVQIPGKNRKEAKENLLIATSQYQRITQEGLDEFAFDLDTNWLADFTSFAGVFDFEPEMEEPSLEDLIGEDKNKPPIMKITFASPEQLQKAEIDIQELLDRKYQGAFFSVSAGEI